MNPSDKFVTALESVHTLLSNYPIHTEIAAIQLEYEQIIARTVVSVQLRHTRLAELAAGLVEWERTLASGRALVLRTPDGTTVQVALLGLIDEDDTLVEAWGSVPYHHDHFGDLEPGTRHPVHTDMLTLWAIDLGPVTP